MRLQEINEAANDVTTWAVKEIVYEKPLLNHPELLGAAREKFSLKEIGELSERLSSDLIDAAVNRALSQNLCKFQNSP